MESCIKQMSCSEEESMASKEEGSSSCSFLRNNFQEAECSMCGDVGLPQYLFKCLTCSHRYQHIYCSKFYPYRIEATICNWCLPMEQLVSTVHEVDDIPDTKVSNFSIRNPKPDIEANSNCPTDPQVHTLEKHTKAFECLLRVAELHDQGHQWDNPACPIEGIIGNIFSVGHAQKNGKVGHIAKKLKNQEPASLMMHQLIISGCSDDQDQSFNAKRGGKIDYRSRPSTSSAQLRHNHSRACLGQDQVGMSQDVGYPLTIQRILNQDLGHDQIIKKLNTNPDLSHNLTIKKLNGEVNPAHHDMQKPATHRVKDHEIGCSDSDQQSLIKCPDTAAVKRIRLHKQLQTAVDSNQHDMNAADQQRMHSQAVSDDSDDQRAGKFLQGAGDNMGPAKRPRYRQSGVHSAAGENDVFNSAAKQRVDVAGNNDLINTAGADDQHRVFSMKQSSPTPHAWSRAAGKRDHLMNSPSRAIKCRYKLLADVLC